MRSELGQSLLARWLFAQMFYPLKWAWFQILLWRVLKPFLVMMACLFILNWGKRMKSI